AASDRWLDAGDGYQLAVRDERIVVRGPRHQALAAVPKAVRLTETWRTVSELVEFLAVHRAACRDTVETWMLRSLDVPAAVIAAVWADPDWRRGLEDLVVACDGVVGILREVDARGLGAVTLDGDTRWSTAATVAIPHPMLLADLDDWRALLVELGATQDCPQLFRETFVDPTPAGAAVRTCAGGTFDRSIEANEAARALGYRVSGGCAVCRVWERGGLVEARYFVGDGDPAEPTTTGDLTWVDANQRALDRSAVGPVAFSEGMRMASGIFAKRSLAGGAGV
ncbi:MAG: DUF4132 domain-containing protein, partial [Myxococcota bacterium]